ncbi:G protein-coupled glucose receptor regulating Gpa2-domain-containing protein, partial [Peziza echinospora]
MDPQRENLQDSETALMKDRELLILRSIAITAASISLASGLLVGYWFIRMKRSFRHHLIMLLICSDFWKASWQLIYPAAVLTQGNIDRDSPFCQATGFFISMGIEASDFAILVIAVHSALYIFRPGTRLGERGLYSYRFYLYGIWLAFPLLMASLAFVNESKAYTSQGTYCYLPARPIWFRLALAWIPRYLILVTILILYASIYIYVRIKFRTFRTNIGAFDMEDVEAAAPQNPQAGPGRIPNLHYHGLITPETPRTEQRMQVSTATDGPASGSADHNNKESQPRALTPSAPRSTDGNYDFPPSHSPSYAMMDSAAPPPASDIIQEATIVSELRKRRYSISRQLRLLFIYPLVYALMWVPPLISHSLQYTEYFADNPSFALQCLVSFTLPAQCAVDCWLFATREKPWLYIPHTGKRTFWFSFAF